MSYQEFKNKYMGKGIDFDGAFGFQCMDLAHRYAVDVVGKDFKPAPGAKDVWNQKIDGYDKIPNSLIEVPQQGDIVVWGATVGPYGHIAVFDNGNSNSFVSFDQNWPVNSLCHLQNHNYNGVLGWFHPKVQVTQPATDTRKQVQFDRITSFLNSISVLPTDKSEDYLDDDKLLKGVQDLNSENVRKQKTIEEQNQTMEQLRQENNNLKTQIVILKEQISSMPSIPPSGDIQTVKQLHEIIYKKWSGYPFGDNYWVKRLRALKKIFEK